MRRVKNGLRITATHLFIIALGLVMLYPVVWMVLSSFKPNNMIFSDTSLWPKVFTLENYAKGWKGYAGISFGRFFANSLTICFISVIGSVVSCTMAAYAFGRLDFTLKGLWFGIMMISIMLPTHVTTIPRYMLYNSFGWVGSYLPIIIPKFLAVDAFFVFLLVQFIRGLPRELDEAATIDGCGRTTIFLRIILPLVGPAMVTTALFTFLWTWDDFFNQLLYLTNPQTYTVSLGLRSFVDASGESSWGSVLAMSTLSMIPCFTLFFTLQKHFVRGIATTGIKG
ncbi:carbohydrate ABC transporter permease [Eubacteriales bacterium OttesenSCG-928-A19]|nr:carbohydrate ABC transporter permease [Eubacteriales bacterium OttesenSCG-928-A19]